MLDKATKISSQFLHSGGISPEWQGNWNWWKACIQWGNTAYHTFAYLHSVCFISVKLSKDQWKINHCTC